MNFSPNRRHRSRRNATIAAGLFVACILFAVRAVAAQRPNILYIIADDLGYGEAGCYGGKDIPTPNIDSLAKSGVRFTSGYVTAPFCAASRAALMTGRYQTRFGFEYNPIGAKNAAPNIGLPVDQKTIGDRLRDAGYATALVGKWHLGGTAPFHPMRRGFDEFFGFMHEGHFYVPQPWNGVTTWLRRKTLPDGTKGRWTSPGGHIVWSTHLDSNEPEYDADNPILRGSQPVDEKANLTDAFTREAISFIDRHKAQPWFLYLAYNAVHSPMQGEDTYMEKFAHIPDIHRRIFAAMTAHLDDGIGRVLAQLRADGLEENTLIVFLSDNGGPTKELTSSNAPLRGGKGELFEGGIRIPFIMSWKGKIPAGKTIDTPIVSMDANVTALEIGNAAPKQEQLDGVNILPLLTGESTTAPHDNLFWRVGRLNALRHGDWKLLRTGGAWQLYDLAHDISETTNVAAQNAARVQELSTLWDQWNGEQIDPLWK
jgi:arylsulfatase B